MSADRRREPNFASPAARRGGPGEENLVDFSEIVPIDRSRRALFGGVRASFFFAREAFFRGGNVNCTTRPAAPIRKKERKKTDTPREGWENGTPPPHRDFKERGVVR